LEGDGFMAVAAFKILDGLRQTLDDGIILEGLEVAAREAAIIMTPVRIAQELLVTTAREEYTRALEVEVSTKAAVATLVVDTSATIGRGGTRPAKTNRASATAQLSGRAADTAAAVTAATVALRKDVLEATMMVRSKGKVLEDSEKAFAEWKTKVGPVTQEEFIQYGKDAVQPGYDYFYNLYINPQGKLRNLFLAFRGAQIFDPFILAGISVTASHLLIDDLIRFGFMEFTPKFITGMKLELTKLMNQAKEEFPWDTLPGADKYDSDLRKKLQARESEEPKPATRVPERRLTWKEDPNERARRIWLWWKVRVHEVQDFRFFNVALRLVALVQPSSCSLERDFSQLKVIVDACGQMLQDTLESRMYERCNNGPNGLPMQ